MSTTTYEFSMFIDVFDKRALYRAAIKHAIAESMQDGAPSMTEKDARAMLKPDGRTIDVHACLIMIIDPGTSPDGTQIVDSVVEER